MTFKIFNMKKVIIITALTVLAASCQRLELSKPLQYGSLSVAMDAEVKVEAVTKAAATPEDLPNYNVKVIGQNQTSHYDGLYSAFQPLKLPLGTTYTVSAENCTAEEAVSGYGHKRLMGTKDVTLSYEKPNQTVNLDCVLVNSLISIIFDSSVTGVFDDLKVTVKSGTRSVEIKESEAVREAWFNPAAISWTISGVSKATGKTVSQEGSRTLDARQNLKITVKVTYSDGLISVIPGISIDKISELKENKNDINPYN